MNKDIFIVHASEDKAAVVHPLVFALEQAGISYWLDDEKIAWGESVTAKVNEGLKISNYVVVILSRAFLSKNWPQRELWAALNREAQTGDAKILPLFVGSDADIQYFLSELPLLNDKRYLVWDGSPQSVVRSFLDLIQRGSRVVPEREDLLICGLCRTPFERGILVCPGCKRTIVYGLTTDERLQKRQLATMGTAALLVIFFLPTALGNMSSQPESKFWSVLRILYNFLSRPTSGINEVRISGIDELGMLVLLFVIGGAVSLIAGFAFEWHVTKKGRNLVRTFP
jgi:hypothetical protein